MYTLRPYQTEAVEAVYRHLREKDTNPCVVIPTAAGKTLCIAQIAKDAATKWGGRVMILAHVKELVEQNAAKLKSICPELPVGVYSAGLDSRDTKEPVVVAGIQSVANKADAFKPFDLVLVDECFPAGTMVSTPRGDIPIEEVAVGTKIFNAKGVGVVQCSSARMSYELVEMELSNGQRITCTPNHPVFADGEWRTAGTLAVGARLAGREEVPGMRKGISSADAAFEKRQAPIRNREVVGAQDILLDGMSVPAQAQHQLGSNGREEVRLLWEDFSSEFLSCAGSDKTDVPQDVGKESLLLEFMRQAQGEPSMGVEEAECRDPEAGRERETSSSSATASAGGAWGRCERGVCDCDNHSATPEEGGARLQGGHRDSALSSCAGDRRGKPSVDGDSTEGREEEDAAGGIRVVRIARLECPGGTPVYNLQVSGHPSYFAGGVLVHNCHLIPPDGEGRYRTFIEAEKRLNPRVRLVGWTATPYRTQGGLICKPENLLNEVCYEVGVKELINRGYISRITARAGKVKADTDALHVRAGEFVAEDVERVMGEDRLVNSACREIVELTKDRKACLIFCASVAHCRKVAEQISRLSGEECAVVTGDTPADEREETIRRLRGEAVKADLFADKPPLRYCCNVSVLTTGTDIPRLDTIALLRPTNSPGLLVQMVGRGFRLSPETGKRECVVLDYGRNIERHGPIDMIKIGERGMGNGEKLAKECPNCRTLVNLSVMLCPECGHEWPRNEPERASHEATAAKAAILSGEVTVETFPVTHVSYQVWEKRGALPSAPKTVRVTYDVDYLTHYSEWLCPEHAGYARRKFERWWREHARPECPVPETAADVCECELAGMLREVKSIRVRFVSGQKYPEVVGCELGDFVGGELGMGNGGEGGENEEEIDYDDLPF